VPPHPLGRVLPDALLQDLAEKARQFEDIAPPIATVRRIDRRHDDEPLASLRPALGKAGDDRQVAPHG